MIGMGFVRLGGRDGMLRALDGMVLFDYAFPTTYESRV